METQNAARGAHTAPAGPTLSVIVPVYNSRRELERCLAALAGSREADFDVLVVDDGSTTHIEPLVSAHRYGYMRLADGPGGPARARNRGAARVSGQHVVFIDADVCVHEDTLARFAAAFAAESQPDAVIGSYDDAPACPSFLSQYKNLFHHFVHQSCAGAVSTFWSGCGAMRRDLFLAFGGFDEERYRRPAIEDIELGTWLHAAGYSIVLDHTIRAKHLKRWTLWGMVKTDILDRGVPWTRLMLRAGAVANTLNVKPGQRISVVLAYFTLLALLIAPFAWSPLWLVAAAALAIALTLLNLDFYRFFYQRAGAWFTLRVVPLHWLYFWYCGVSVACGTALHCLDRGAARGEAGPRPRLDSKAQPG